VLGSVGFIITSFGIGYIFERTGLVFLFYSYALMMSLFLITAFYLPNERIRLAGSLLGGLGQMVRQPAWLIFAVSAFLLWISNNGVMNFIGITVQQMGGSASMIGWVWMAAALAEVPVMIFSGQLLKRVGSTRLLLIAFSLFAVRSALLANMTVPESAPFINSLGGISYALFWISAVNYANDTAPDHLKATAQGLLFSILNLANMAGAFSAGLLFDQVGPSNLFWVMAGAALVGLVVFSFGRLRFR
jgi:MFS transporter, PPP family, 3-phenylpropionic acid transporter